MTTVSLSTTDSLESLHLKDGDVVTGEVSNGKLVVSVQSADQVAKLEQSLDESRAAPPIPLEPDFFDRMRERGRAAGESR